MTLEELKSLRQEEVVVFTKVDKLITEYHEYEVGDELEFMDIYTEDKHGRNVANFYRKAQLDLSSYNLPLPSVGEMGVIAHFSYSVCDYIERKVKLERENKLVSLGI
jgi:hypothetical protein